MLRRRFKWKSGRVVVEIPPDEQEMLRHVLPQLREMLMADDDPALRRLAPPARPDDEEAEHEYRDMVGDDLLRTRLEAIELVENGIEGASLDEDQVGAWMQSLNALRLILGERLDIDMIGNEALTDLDPDDDRAPVLALFEWIGWLLEQLVEAAMNEFDD